MKTKSLNTWGNTTEGRYMSLAYALVILTVFGILIKVPIDMGLLVIPIAARSLLDVVTKSLLVFSHISFLIYFIYFGLIKQEVSIPSSGGGYKSSIFIVYKGKSAIYVSICFICLILFLFIITTRDYL